MNHQKINDVDVIPSESQWFGVNYASDKETSVAQLQEMTDNKEYPSPVWGDTHNN